MKNFDDYINSYLSRYIFEQNEPETTDKYKLGIFIGKFKPPHRGHFNTLAGILGEGENVFSTRYPQDIPDCICNEAVVVVSNKPVISGENGKELPAKSISDLKKQGMSTEDIARQLGAGMIFTDELAKNIWDLFITTSSIAGKAEVRIDHPVSGAISLLENIKNTGSYKGIPIDRLNIRLFVGEEEGDDNEIDVKETENQMKRYSYILKNQREILGTDDEEPVKVCVMGRSTSATVVREKILRVSIEGSDIQTLQENIPEHVDVSAFWDLASQAVIR